MSDLPSRASDAGPEPADEMDWRDYLYEVEDSVRRASRDPEHAVRHMAEAAEWLAKAEAAK